MRGTDPTVGFIPTHPFKEAGQMIDPSVSVPTASETKPAETAAPEPEEDPPALCACRHGFAVSPPTADHPLVDLLERIFAHSERLVAPMMFAPAARNRDTIAESRSTGYPARASEPAVPGRPTASILSLIKIGSPAKGKAISICSAFSRASDERAST